MKYVELSATNLKEYLDSCIRRGLPLQESISKTARQALKEAEKLLKVSELLESEKEEVDVDLRQQSGILCLCVPDALAERLIAENLATYSEYQES